MYQSFWGIDKAVLIERKGITLNQQFSTSVHKNFHAIPDYLVRSTDLLPLKLSNKNMTIVNTTVVISNDYCSELIKLTPIFLSDQQQYNKIFGVPQNFNK